ncbi:NAD(P)/FAD-dependent oxidoreductase [Desulforamulus ferrireducens]|uniref:Sulfite reductase, assimilatory-type n=1 Tax=Desulforamulus ferrireducens TaxID=1833852 RepID=A0A1S6ITH0_9FIRM|nr:NAD(P)/FAD-dependent oxidoreductase [Desulforamulus ferrireducens]AQS58079.1 sulfite reductase, assimilatory-type [Desulforamulus ferrireducens]
MSEQNAPKGAFIQRDKQTYAIVPRIPVGLVTPDLLENIARVARKYEIPIIKLTSAQRMALVGMKPEIVDDVWQDLGTAIGPAVGLCVHYVQACPGTTVCKYGVLDSLNLGLRLEELLVGYELPAKTKIGVSGCPFNCGEGYVRDIGIFGRRSGWTLIFGGNSGGRPRIGDVIAEGLSDDQVVELTMKCLNYYKENAKKMERTARFIQRIGIEEFKKAVLG